MARQDFRRRKRRQEALEHELEVPILAEEMSEDPVPDKVAPPARDHALAVAGWIGLLAAGALAGLQVMDLPADGALPSATSALGVTPGLLGALGIVLLVAGAMFRRLGRVESSVGQELQGLATISERTQSLSRGLESFQERLEAIRSDRVAATLNQIRYEVSSLHEKVHREIFPTKDLHPVVEDLSRRSEGVLEKVERSNEQFDLLAKAVTDGFEFVRERFEHLEDRWTRLEEAGPDHDASGIASAELQKFCDSLQDAVHRLDPGIRSIQSAVEFGQSNADRNLQNIAQLVERLENEIRDLDHKADRILNLSHATGDSTGGQLPADEAPVPGAPVETAAEPKAGTTEPGDDPAVEPSTIHSAIERLKHLRGE